ncbi:MAG: CHAT domain-containing protein [Scytonematopsis contorta HA4267-MV1]|nr:CHAT domain-containing protein [Scytonematopsis contorta HA4267-MV1]
MVMTLLLCITSPSFARVSTNTAISSSSSSSSSSLEEQGRELYNQGKFSEATKLFLQSAQAYQVAKDPIRQALSLSNLSLCYQQLGQWQDASRSITDSIKLLNDTKDTREKALALAQSYEILGGLQLARGQSEAALKSWENSTLIYTQQNKPNRVLASQTNEAQALQNLGLYRRAISLLEKALKLPPNSTIRVVTSDHIKIDKTQGTQVNPNEEKLKTLKTLLQKIPASSETATALRTLGDSLRVVGELPQALRVLERTVEIGNQLQRRDIITLTKISLGNTARTQGEPKVQKALDAQINSGSNSPIQVPPETQAALNFYQQAASSSPTGNLRVEAQVNQLSLLVRTQQVDAAKKLIPELQQQIKALPSSNAAVDTGVNLAQTMMELYKQNPSGVSVREIADILALAVQQAKELGNPRTQADALGSLGNVYEETKQWSLAQKLTEQALQLAQQINAGDIAFRWQWQLGRIMKAQENIDGAIASYKEAVGTIKSLRTDLATASPDVQFSFRKAVEPIHRELVGLLLKSRQKDNLQKARDIIEGLQLVELDNFFREACLNANPEQIDQVDQRAAVIYPIILEDELAVIASLPKVDNNSAKNNPKQESRDYRYYRTSIKKEIVENRTSRLLNLLRQDNTLSKASPLLKEIYGLIFPESAASDIAASKAETLVFVLDGVLRNIPMSALYDGKQYLIEKYSIAMTPGLQLLAPRSLRQERLGALVAGLGEARSGFSALPNVKIEVQKIQSELPSQVLLNEQFTNSKFESRISAITYPIVHLATHGQFGSTAEDTFILTWDSKIKVNELSSVLKTVELSKDNSLELLVLSACETAAGDDKSALGLAGVAVRSGARSTVATLWRVNDEASATLMSQFYEQLVQANKTGISKAEALRRAQIAILKNDNYKSPYYWAPYVLLGNWI